MRRLPGLLAVDVRGVDGAVATVDGERVGETPLPTLELEPGEHELRIASERHEEFVTTVAIEGGGATQTLTVDLVPRWAPVTLATRPPGATIRANGEEVGVTPATLELIEGAYTIEFDLAGHKSQRRRITVEANTPQTLPTVTLQLTDGRLMLRSEPDGATVSVDDVYRGVTPLELYLPPGRDHQVELSKAGYETATRTVSVRSGRTSEEQITLPALRGEITVKTDPAGAELLVDGKSRGEANQTLSLVAVPHEIEVRKAGHEGYRTTVTPRPGVPQLVDVTLKSAEQLQAEATPPRLRSPQGQDMVLVQGGRFMMGASRREPGRRSNETMHEVELARPFYIATKEVSNGEFREFKSEHLSGKAGGVSLEADHHPAVRVKWSDAALYCNWLSGQEGLPAAYEKRGGRVTLIQPPTTGYRLPTEAEWAFVTRYPDGKTPTKYEWGDALPPPDDSGNYGDESAERLLPDAIDGYDDHYPGTAPVDSFTPNPLGLYNLGGNVAEWVHDYYSVYPSRSGKVERDPIGPGTGTDHVIRGAGWMDGVMSELRLTYRDQGSKPRPDVGFRVARYAE
jgi:formylglycine-generating enzyme required for sulfatase activity